ncbi:peptidoglycan-binding protein LysM [Larkinella rosea]|uniref:Potassium binding protein Kbp n=1 Tax=Larkinella rosea TaxID=2025312 RepID=A0A3P1B986_9BACT|nr:peptidoglycan-binding protein LysM [Larkinella rosea]RRA97676.1 peptidoglycan-binding protein LysM [Larkinella rosea]
MGLLSFFKGVGEKVFGQEHTAPASEPAKAAEVEPLKASALLNHVKQLGLSYKKLTVKTAGDTVVLEGQVASQEDAEKLALAVGNVEGVHQVDNRLVVDTPEPEGQFHTVESGDTLSAISKKVYGDAMKYGIIFEANKPMLKSPDLIYPGQVLRIPRL